MTISSSKNGRTAIQNKIALRQICKDIQWQMLTAAEAPPWNGKLKYYWGLKSILRGHNPRS